MTPGHVLRAALDAMANNYFQCVSRLPACEYTGAVFSGGLAMKSADLQRKIALKLALPIRAGLGVEDTLFGLLIGARHIRLGESIATIISEQKKSLGAH